MVMQYPFPAHCKLESPYESGSLARDDLKLSTHFQIHQLSRNMDDVRIIAAVQKRKALYDKTDPKYSNRDAVRSFWIDCAAEVGMEVEPTKKRWAYLRDYFMKQHRVMKLAKSGLAASRKKKWPLFDSMGFLVPFIQQRTPFPGCPNPEGNTTEDEEESTSAPLPVAEPILPSVTAETNPSRPDTPVYTASASTASEIGAGKRAAGEWTRCPASKRMKSSTPAATTSNPFPFDLSVLRPLRETIEMDESEHFFKSLLPTVRRLDPVAALEFRIEVHNLLLRYVKAATTFVSASSPAETPAQSPFSPDTAPQQFSQQAPNGDGADEFESWA